MMTVRDSCTPVFSETQRIKNYWILPVALVFAVTIAFLWYGLYRQVVLGHPFGNHPAPNGFLVAMVVLETLVCLAVCTFIASMKLVVEVRNDALSIHFFPIKKMQIPYASIVRFQARDYRPVKEYGGWGVKFSWSRNARAFTVSGHRGVEIFLDNGERVMLGSQRPDELAAVLGSYVKPNPAPQK